MKIISLFLALIICISAEAQNSSYYFSIPVPGEVCRNVNTIHFGNYDDGKGRIYSFSDSGVFILSTTVSSISRSFLRESSQYRVENGYLFGVLANDSIPCIQEGENYFFGIRNRDVLVGEGSRHLLVRSSNDQNTYYLNYEENGVYTPIRMRFIKGKLEISSLEYDSESTVFDAVKERKSITEGSINLVLLKPSKEEFEGLVSAGIFGMPTIYARVK